MDYIVTEPSFNFNNLSKISVNTKFITSTEESIYKKTMAESDLNNSKNISKNNRKLTKSLPDITVNQNSSNTLKRFYKPEIEYVNNLNFDSIFMETKKKTMPLINSNLIQLIKFKNESKEDGKSNINIVNN